MLEPAYLYLQYNLTRIAFLHALPATGFHLLLLGFFFLSLLKSAVGMQWEACPMPVVNIRIFRGRNYQGQFSWYWSTV